ncbi:MAG: radical SAM protein, partial [Clostridiales bacterium]|nr:radical SAM protein [Clostridiales bacterium]
MAITYQVASGLYLNITNRCSNRCIFCVRNFADAVGDASSLWLPQEPSLEEIWAEICARDLSVYKELVFCGFGEPTERLDVLLAIAARVRQSAPFLPIR